MPYPPDRRRGALRLIPPARSRHAAVCTKARALLQERIMHLVNMRTEMSWDILNRNRVLSKTTESQKTQLQGIMMERAWRGCRPLNRTVAHLHSVSSHGGAQRSPLAMRSVCLHRRNGRSGRVPRSSRVCMCMGVTVPPQYPVRLACADMYPRSPEQSC